MTREKAKNWLNKLFARTDITDEYGDMEDMQPYEEAYNMAIEAMSVMEKIEKFCRKSPSAILPEDILSLMRGETVELETDYGYEEFPEKKDDKMTQQAILCNYYQDGYRQGYDDCRKADGEMVSMSVIEDIKAEISVLSDSEQIDPHTIKFTNWVGMKKKVIDIIDKHISGKENNG